MLTPRQREVAELVGQMLSTKAVARELGISVRTVEVHISAAASRLPGDGAPREKLVAFFSPRGPETF